MVTDLDIDRTAQVLLRQHGADAPVHAAMRYDTLLEQGALEEAAWKRVLAAIDVLLLNENGWHFASMVDAHAAKLSL